MTFDTYVEPMAGGAALFWYMKSVGLLNGKEVILSDVNEPVIDLYQTIRDDPESIFSPLAVLKKNYKNNPEKTYYDARNQWNEGFCNPATFIFLKQTSFNGLWRENSNGLVNMPWGKYKTLNVPSNLQLLEYSKALQGVVLNMTEYDYVMPQYAGPKTFAYIDPPYFKTFDKYNAKGFSKGDHKKLIADCGKYSKAGTTILYSNRYFIQIADWVAHSWAGATMKVLPVKSTIAGTKKDRKTELDLLVWG